MQSLMDAWWCWRIPTPTSTQAFSYAPLCPVATVEIAVAYGFGNM